MSAKCPSLIEALAQVEDPRKARGKRHPLVAILALSVAATLCGAQSYGAIAEWGRDHGAPLARALGFTRDQTPCAGTLHYLFQQLDRRALERVLAVWAQAVLATCPPAKGSLEALAIDGKTLRGSQKQGALDVHLISVLSHRLGLTLYQQAVSDKTNEIGALPEVLATLVLEGRVLTADAMHCQRATAQQIVDRGGHYVLMVKGNQGTLEATIETLLGSPVACRVERQRVVERDAGHGRLERRELICSDVLAGEGVFPGLVRIFRVTRERQEKKSGKREVEVTHGIASLTKEQAGPRQLLALTRRHWHIENKSHHVRDVTYREDASQVRDGTIAQVMAALRNTAIGVMRVAGKTNIASATRHYAGHPGEALVLLGLTPDF